ncbi:hypothetical protein CHLNCDRAFT_145354 [Chlorella variabilis]|uniref:Glycoside hydrolase family 38 N-terminal domain-containing protein n=1 Tax=Chlorella variabilis TaxID=554065 RepID=E1ZE88_CHLVA|nr:hypothetical protein CHLNCDRAFT_145354 [Chlorella variabilis]EFN55987.1 hypothetical protein CHLNCDRAFT_145354 [Chlorella variabilis]|eukprot:XP_005848089.1 hypothetical protein CHLNCDRAFT_145354 [Chlorella variabilis]
MAPSRVAALLLVALCLAALASFADANKAAPAKHISKVSLLFACHLDVGFHSGGPEPGYDNFVISRYFNEYFPRAAQVAQQLRDRPGSPERLVFLTHSWLVSLFLDCAARIGIQCPNATTVADVRQAVQQGDIVWHALPHNAQVELYDASLLQFAVRMTHELDRAFGLPPKVTASQRDVPGLTRAAVPILADEGVKAISVGVNGGSAPPAVPKNTPFIWRDLPSGKQLLAMWHPGGYSGFPVDSRDECVQVEGLHHAMCFAWSGDNTGPPTAEELLDIWKRVQQNFPKAKVAAAGFDGFVADLEAAAPGLKLPVVTAEIGDTWIHGAASDPAKLSEYRALLRMRTASQERYDDEPFKKFSRLLLKARDARCLRCSLLCCHLLLTVTTVNLSCLQVQMPEHTFGVDTKEYPGEWDSWSNKAASGADLQEQLFNKRKDNPFLVAVGSWVRHRAYSLWAVQELGASPEGFRAWGILSTLQEGKAPPTPGAANTSFKRCSLQEPLRFESDSWQLELSNMTGAIVGLSFKPAGAGGQPGSTHPSSSSPSPWARLLAALRLPGSGLFAASGGGGDGGGGSSWAGFNAPLALPVYSTYAEEDYDAIWDSYSYFPRDRLADWFYKDFGKPNATVKGGARRAEYLPQAQEVWWRRSDEGGLHVTVKATFDDYAVTHAGAPRALWTEIRWVGAAHGQLPVNSSTWLMWKLGQPISPLEVIRNGSHGLHAVGDEGISVDSADGRRRLHIRSLDAAVVSPGRHTPFPSLSVPPELLYGASYCLSNNIWGTNFPMWFPYQTGDANMRFRFVLQLESLTPAAAEA